MFVNPKILKRLMKEAFKANSLIIGRKEDDMFIQGQYWQFLCDRKFVQKTIYAEIIELSGEIPEEGECFCAGKNGNKMQVHSMEIPFPINAKEVAVTDFVLLHKTGVAQRIIQFQSGETVLINEKLLAATRGKHYEEEQGEHEALGPYCTLEHGVLWKNNTGKFRILFRQDDEHESVLKHLESVDLTEKDEVR